MTGCTCNPRRLGPADPRRHPLESADRDELACPIHHRPFAATVLEVIEPVDITPAAHPICVGCGQPGTPEARRCGCVWIRHADGGVCVDHRQCVHEEASCS